MQLEPVLRTVLIAEIMYALPLAIALGDQGWAAQLAHFQNGAEAEVQAAGGKTLCQLTAGISASFEDAPAAVAAGTRILERAAGTGLPVRAAAHRSELLIDEAGQVVGAGLLLAELMLEKGRVGELIGSKTVIDALDRSVETADEAGRWRFEGLPQPWSIFRLAVVTNAAFEASRSGVLAATMTPSSTLTRRETQIATLLSQGVTNREIATGLNIALTTVERHISNMLHKLGFRSRVQIAAWMAEHDTGPRK